MSSKIDSGPKDVSVLPLEVARLLGARRAAVARRVMRLTGLPLEAVLDLAFELVDVSAQKIALPPLKRQAVGLGAARWRNVSPAVRSEELRKVARARWAKGRKKTQSDRE